MTTSVTTTLPSVSVDVDHDLPTIDAGENPTVAPELTFGSFGVHDDIVAALLGGFGQASGGVQLRVAGQNRDPHRTDPFPRTVPRRGRPAR